MHEPRPLFRAATIEDFDAVIGLLTATRLPVAGVADMFANDPSQFLLATDANDVVAVAGI